MGEAAAVASCAEAIFLSGTPWVLFLLVGAYFWAKREISIDKRIADLGAKHLAELEELIRLHGIHSANMKKIHEKDLHILRDAKNFVWLSVSDKNEVYECPDCGFRQKPGATAKN